MLSHAGPQCITISWVFLCQAIHFVPINRLITNSHLDLGRSSVPQSCLGVYGSEALTGTAKLFWYGQSFFAIRLYALLLDRSPRVRGAADHFEQLGSEP